MIMENDKFEAGDVVEVITSQLGWYRGIYKKGMVGQVSEVVGHSLKLYGDSSSLGQLWISVAWVKRIRKAQRINIGDTVAVVKQGQHSDLESFGMEGVVKSDNALLSGARGQCFGVEILTLDCLAWYSEDALMVIKTADIEPPKAARIRLGDTVEIIETDDSRGKGLVMPIGTKGLVVKSAKHAVGVKFGSATGYSWVTRQGLKIINRERKYPNPPLPHCEERIAFANGANIQVLSSDRWYDISKPNFDKESTYRVKEEPVKTKDDLRIEELERRIRVNEDANRIHKNELDELRPKVPY
jgi:hypothetical protein